MTRFRDFIKDHLQIVLVCFIIGSTLFSAVIGALFGTAIANATKGGIEWAVIMFFTVGAVGLLAAATLSSIALTLAEIATNSSETIDLLRRLNQALVRKTLTESEPRALGDLSQSSIFSDVTKELTAQSLSIMRSAKKEGYEVTIAPNKKSITIHKSNDQHLVASNNQIYLLGQSKGWSSA